jgi:hypothetical protein
MDSLWEVFGDRIISSGLCAARSGSLHPCHFYLRGTVKQMFTDQSITQLKNSREIAQGTISIFPQKFKLVNVEDTCGTTEDIPETVGI